MFVSHKAPSYPTPHSHKNPLTSSTHVALFKHGLLLHSSMLVAHEEPRNP